MLPEYPCNTYTEKSCKIDRCSQFNRIPLYSGIQVALLMEGGGVL